MSPDPAWVKKLVPSGPEGSKLLEAKRAKLSVDGSSNSLIGKDELLKRDRILEILKVENVFDKSSNYFLGRTERFQTTLTTVIWLRQHSVRHRWNRDEHEVASDLISELGSYGLDASMFLIGPHSQGTPEHLKLFLDKAEDCEVIGWYAQTELGYDSNARGLEIITTWNTEENTVTMLYPHLTTSKRWIESFGRTANHTAVMAKLMNDGKNYGPCPFVRDAKECWTGENQMLKYAMVQIRLLPLLAATMALHFTGKMMMALHEAKQQQPCSNPREGVSKRGTGPEEFNLVTDLLLDLHATFCSFKALAINTAVNGLEVSWMAWTGHGHNSFGGIGNGYGDYLPVRKATDQPRRFY